MLKITKSPYFLPFTLFLSFDALLYVYIFFFQVKLLEIFLNFWGSFVATLIGVYISLYIANEITRNSEKTKKKEILLGSLKLIFSEISVNEMNLEDVKDALRTMPQEITSFYDNFAMLESAMIALKTQAFYGIIASGDMREITTKPEIFNPIQQAYFNMELSISSFNATKIFFKDFSNNTSRVTEENRKQCINNLEKVKNNLERTAKILGNAKIAVECFLKSEGVVISEDIAIKNL